MNAANGPADGAAALPDPTTSVAPKQDPAPMGVAFASVARCVGTAADMLLRGRLQMPRTWVGTRLHFADGTSARVYRETTAVREPAADPCVLIVGFRLRWVRGRGHAVFRWTSIVNTPLFVGFPGFLAKWWLAADDAGRYRGVYQWDGADQAERYARSLWRVLALVSVPGSIRYHILAGSRRDELARHPDTRVAPADDAQWWRITDADPADTSIHLGIHLGRHRVRQQSAPERDGTGAEAASG